MLSPNEKRELLSLEEMRVARAEEDPLHVWQPTLKQRPFIDAVLKGTTDENWMVAANRSGKSDAGGNCGSTLARKGNRDTRSAYHEGGDLVITDFSTSGWVISLDFPTSRDVIQPKYFDNGFVPASSTHAPFIPEREIAKNGWRSSDQILKLKNGSIIGFKSADSGRRKFQGTEKDWIHIDEEPDKSIYEESVIRVGQRPLKIFGTCTLLPPEGQVGGVTWVYTDIIKPCLKGELPHVGIFGASIYDNPFIDPGEIRRLETIYPEGSILNKIRLKGEWLPGLSGARAYPSFNAGIHSRHQPPINFRRPLCWIWDFNVEPMISLVGQVDLRVYRVMREFILDEGSVPDMVDFFREVYPKHGAEIWLYGDATGKNRTAQTGKSDYTLIMNAMRAYGAPLKLKIPEVNPHVPDRINSVQRLLKDEQGEVRLEIEPNCTELISDMEQVLRDSRGGIKKTHNKKDPYYRRTHTSDALGYWLSREEPVVSNIPRPNMIKTLTVPGYAFNH